MTQDELFELAKETIQDERISDLKELTKQGFINLNHIGREGETLLSVAIENKSVEAVKVLCESDDININLRREVYDSFAETTDYFTPLEDVLFCRPLMRSSYDPKLSQSEQEIAIILRQHGANADFGSFMGEPKYSNYVQGVIGFINRIDRNTKGMCQ